MPEESPRSFRPLAFVILLLALALGAILDGVLAHQLLKRQHDWAVQAQLVKDPHPWIRGRGRCSSQPHWAPGHGRCLEV